MKEKLVEQWLIKARERGGIDQAFGQWLISQGHEILWLGHSGFEFGKDITTKGPDGLFHSYQIKDEDINLNELRKIMPQLTELVEVPPVHPSISPGTIVKPHVVTSGIFNETATALVRALNEGWIARGFGSLEIIDRHKLIPRFVGMSDSFWPETPANLRDFFSFYLAEGKGDFAPEKFGDVLIGLLPLKQESQRQKAQRLAAVGLLGNYLLEPFSREEDHWNLFRGWTIIAAYQAWFASKSSLEPKDWRPSFNLAKYAAIRHLKALGLECLEAEGFTPSGLEMDDYTSARNLLLASALASHSLLDQSLDSAHKSKIETRLEFLLQNNRFFLWGEGAIPCVLIVQWCMEKWQQNCQAIPLIEEAISELCERNHPYAEEDDPFFPPRISPDEVLTRLFQCAEIDKTCSRRSWTLEIMLHFLARRGMRNFMDHNWKSISKIELSSFMPESPVDILLWECEQGLESSRHLETPQSWSRLIEEAHKNESSTLPQILQDDRDFSILFLLAYPHRISSALVRHLDLFWSYALENAKSCAVGETRLAAP